MNAPDTAAQAADALPALMGRLGAQAKAASAAMARATAAQKSQVLRDLAGLLRAHAGPQAAREQVAAVDLGRDGRDMVGGKAFHLVAQQIGGFAKVEVEGGEAVRGHAPA